MGLGLGARVGQWLGARLWRAAARRRRGSVLSVILLAAVAAGCSSRPYGTLIVGSTAPNAGQVDLLVATTRAPVVQPPGVMFGGARGRGLDFADIVVSIPPDSVRRSGDIELPSSVPGNPERDFVILRADRMDLVAVSRPSGHERTDADDRVVDQLGEIVTHRGSDLGR